MSFDFQLTHLNSLTQRVHNLPFRSIRDTTIPPSCPDHRAPLSSLAAKTPPSCAVTTLLAPLTEPCWLGQTPALLKFNYLPMVTPKADKTHNHNDWSHFKFVRVLSIPILLLHFLVDRVPGGLCHTFFSYSNSQHIFLLLPFNWPPVH